MRLPTCATPPVAAHRSSAFPNSSAPSISASARTRALRPRRADSRPQHRALLCRSPANRSSHRRLALRAPRPRPLPQHRRRHRRRRRNPRHLSQDAHPRRSALLREVSTSPPATSASAPSTRSYGRSARCVCWDQWYPEGARLTALQGANVLFYPTAIGWHPAEKEEYGAAQHDAWQHHPARPRHRQRRLRRRGQSRRPRNRQHSRQPGARCGPGVLGRLVPLRSFRPRHRPGLARQRGDSARRVDLKLHRRDSPQLALPARPPHRRLRAHHADGSGK